MDRCATADGGESLGQAAIREERGIDAVRELPKLLQGGFDVVPKLLEECRCLRRVGAGQLTREAQIRAQRDQLLLRAVVEVALDAAPLGVRRRDDAGAGGSDLLGLPLHLVERRLELRVEPDVVQSEADLPGELGEHALVELAEGLATGPALSHDQPQQLPGVRHRSDPERSTAAILEECRQPHLEPGGPGDTGPGDHGLLRRGECEARPAALGIGRHPLE